MTACVRVVHKPCGGTIAVAVPDGDTGVAIAVNELIIEGLHEIRKQVPNHGDRRLVVGVWQHYPTAAAMPARFAARCERCDVDCHVERRPIAAKVAIVRESSGTLGA